MTRTQFILRDDSGDRIAFELAPDENADVVRRRLETAHRRRARAVVRIIDPRSGQSADYSVDASTLAQVELLERLGPTRPTFAGLVHAECGRLRAVQLDLHVSRFTFPGGAPDLGPTVAAIAQSAEEIGVRTLSFMDHWFQMEAMWPAEEPMLEGYTALGFVAGNTERLRLRLLVGGVTYRHPGLLAKTVTTLDVLSGGRAELGLGAAWYEREHRGLGVPFPPLAERFERLEEALQICLQMWSDDNGPYKGKHYQLAETLCSPQPLSEPRPRILIGGSGERKTLRLVAQYADACNIFGDAAAVASKVAVLRRHCDDVGRDPRDIEVTAMVSAEGEDPDTDEILRTIEHLGAVGVHTVVASSRGPDPAGGLRDLWGPLIPRIAAIPTADGG